MQVRDLMTENVQMIASDKTLAEAGKLMETVDTGIILVCEGETVVGVLTDRDIVVRAVAEGDDPNRTRVGDVMTPDPVFCADEEDVKDAARMMEERQVRRLPVLDRQLQLVGIVSLGDLVTRGDKELAGQVLEQVSQPTIHAAWSTALLDQTGTPVLSAAYGIEA